MCDQTMPRMERVDWKRNQNELFSKLNVKCGCLRSNDFRCCQRFIDPRSSQQWQSLHCGFRWIEIYRSFTFDGASIDFVRCLLFHDFIFGQNGCSDFWYDFHSCWLGGLTSGSYQLSHPNFYQRFRVRRRFSRWWRWGRWFDATIHNYFLPHWWRCVCERFSQSFVVWLQKWRLIVCKVIRCYKCRPVICQHMMSQKSWIYVNLWWWRNDDAFANRFS